MRRYLLLGLVVGGFLGCGDGVSSDEQARRAYLGLDASIDKAIQLGFDGFNAASSANISPQTTNGTTAGTLTVTGQVDQGSSANKGMRLFTAFAGYSDDGKLVYATNASALPALNMQLKGIPTGTMTGTLVGTLMMTGELSGDVTLNLSFNSTLQAGSGSTVSRKPGTTVITGTAISAGGTYQVNVTR
ncbi:MAG: hypothetical protein JNM40_00960 [Myxococcales bacterium]|nr:hypothetical protein [Myxococcales bacterium]